MAAQGSQFRFNNGAPAETSPRSLGGGLASGLANIGGGQPDVDVLMSQYAAAQNNDPEALVRGSRALRARRACGAAGTPGQFCASAAPPTAASVRARAAMLQPMAGLHGCERNHAAALAPKRAQKLAGNAPRPGNLETRCSARARASACAARCTPALLLYLTGLARCFVRADARPCAWLLPPAPRSFARRRICSRCSTPARARWTPTCPCATASRWTPA